MFGHSVTAFTILRILFRILYWIFLLNCSDRYEWISICNCYQCCSNLCGLNMGSRAISTCRFELLHCTHHHHHIQKIYCTKDMRKPYVVYLGPPVPCTIPHFPCCDYTSSIADIHKDRPGAGMEIHSPCACPVFYRQSPGDASQW